MVQSGYGAGWALRNLTIGLLLTTGAVNAETVTVAALGDSLTAGYGLSTADGFVPQLEVWLQDQGADVKVVNAGVSGDTTAGGLSRVDWTLTPDVDAMIVTLGGNDYLRAIDPAVSRDNLDQILATGDAAGVEMLLVGINAGANYGADFQTAFNNMYPELAEKHDVPLYPGFFAGLLDAAGTQDNVRDYMQADGVHPNAEGVGLIVAAIGPSVLQLIERVE